MDLMNMLITSQYLHNNSDGGGNGESGDGEKWIGDGNTHVWISLTDGRTSPMMGVCPNGTVTVDWGDGTTPNILTGSSTSSVKWTPIHNYAVAGDYVITLTVDGEMGFSGDNRTWGGSYILRQSNSDDVRNRAYANTIQKVELGDGVTRINNYAFYCCGRLAGFYVSDGVNYIGESAFRYCQNLMGNIDIPVGVTQIGSYAFASCRNLSRVAIPNGVTIGSYAFQDCRNLSRVAISNGVTFIGDYAFQECNSLSDITIPDGVTIIRSSVFQSCGLKNVTISDSVTSIGDSAFSNCDALRKVIIPSGVISIGNYAFNDCECLASVTVLGNLTSIGNSAFNRCPSALFYDFTQHTTIPTLSATNVFSNIPKDCEIRVPAALYDQWIAATNWSSIASNIVAV